MMQRLFLRGISPNPFSQEIHFVLEELRLRTGNAAGLSVNRNSGAI